MRQGFVIWIWATCKAVNRFEWSLLFADHQHYQKPVQRGTRVERTPASVYGPAESIL